MFVIKRGDVTCVSEGKRLDLVDIVEYIVDKVSLSFFVKPMRRKSRSVAVESVTRERGSMSAEVLRRKKRIRVRWFSLVWSWDSRSRRVSVLRAMRARRNMRRISRILSWPVPAPAFRKTSQDLW